jgi:geranylgeranyl pyrophosphate synthase
MAICAGDYGFFLSYSLLTRCAVAADVLARMQRLYAKILTITCEGEIMDVALPHEALSITEDYERYKDAVTAVYERKTAWYTIAGPLMLGAVCGGADDELTELLREIAIPLGVAFQIKDDLLGIFSTDPALGKSALSDIRENKQTLLYGYAYKHSDERGRALLERHYGKADADVDDLATVRRVLEETGARDYAQDEIRRLSDISRSLIANELIAEEYQLLLRGLLGYLIGRTY